MTNGDLIFILLYLLLVGVIAKVVRNISSRQPKENWAIRTFEAFYPGFNSQGEAEEYIKEKGWGNEAQAVRLAD